MSHPNPVEAELEEYRAAIDVLAQKRSALSQSYALRAWLKGFPEEIESFRVGVGVLPKLKGQHGDPFFLQLLRKGHPAGGRGAIAVE